MNEKELARVLAWVNAQRKKMGRVPIKKFPRAKGPMGSPTDCAIATALGRKGVNVSYSGYRPKNNLNARYIKFPAFMMKFHDALLYGQLPQFQAKQ